MALSKEEKQRRSDERKRKKYNKTHKNINGVECKLCSRCAKWLPATKEYFHKHNTNSDGLFPYCKECNIKKSTKRIYANYDDFKAYLREYDKQPRIKKQKNLRQVRFREKGGLRKWQQNNPEKIKKYYFDRMNKEHEISKQEWEVCLEYFNHSCAYCGISNDEAKKKYNNYLHKEHVIHNGSNKIDNCVPACKSCNSSKGVYDLKEWYELQEFYSELRYNKIMKWLNGDYKRCILTYDEIETR